MIDTLGLAVLHLQATSRERPGDDQWYYDLFGPPASVRRMRRQAYWKAARNVMRVLAGRTPWRAELQRASGVPS